MRNTRFNTTKKRENKHYQQDCNTLLNSQLLITTITHGTKRTKCGSHHSKKIGCGISQPVQDDDEADDSYNPSNDEEDEAGAHNTISMDAFQTKMCTGFEQLQINQEIQGMQLTEIVESTCCYANELAHQRASIDRQKIIVARLCQRFMLDQGSKRTDFGP
ncbi:hypothetical protein M9H77_27165 [Catharanthus roseus]|uniref:Uncharacterized protein n=1 Tax=Catharanthus roseus TaxID=4058 RepID=A0ACC0AD68_CATRO|nr:hypothetical protein M9H77_27165 [Catharanthus roseus]